MDARIAAKREELEAAVNQGAEAILLEADLAAKVQKGYAITELSSSAMAGLGASLGLAPYTGGISLAAAPAIAWSVGLKKETVLAVAFLGLKLMREIAAYYQREEVELEDEQGRYITLCLKKHNPKE